MFDLVRKHTRILQFVLFLLIVPSFALVGLEGYNRMSDRGAVVAKVAGHDVTQADWDQAHRNEVERIRASMPGVDNRLLDSPDLKYATLERLVRDRVLVAAAEKSGLQTSDARLARELHDNPNIAGLRRPDGSLDMDQYRQLIGSQGMTPQMFEERVRADLSARQVVQGVTATGFAPDAVADTALGAFFDRRNVQVARFAASDFAARVNLSDADLETYYQAHQADFRSPEQASIEYVVLDLDAVRKGITLSEQDLRSYYDQNIARLSGQEERRASHILITAAASAPASERQAARAKAEALLAEVRKAPDSFADVARKNSQDPGSAAQGGDLDFFARGAMAKPFEDAVFAMEKGAISDVVESDFGYHIIRLTDIKKPPQRSFAEMRPELEADLKRQQAQSRFAEAAETFTNGVYEQSDSLKPAADKLGLEIRTATQVARRPAPDTTGALANERFLNALFAPETLETKRNTEAIEIGPSQLVAGRVTQYSAAHTLPLAEVKERVRDRLRAERAADLARKEGAEKLEAWKANPATAALPAAIVVGREQANQQPARVVEAALRADPAALPAWTGVDLGSEGYAVVKVNAVVARETADAQRASQEREQYAQAWTGAENLAYYGVLKERVKARILVAKPVPAAADEHGHETR